jgi:hypothetical protein
MNPASSNLLTFCQMVSCLPSVYLLSFCLIGLYDGSMPNLCSIISLGIQTYLISPMQRHQDCLRESEEREFLFGVEVVIDPELLIWVVGVQCNLLVFCPQGSLQFSVYLLIDGRWSRCRCNSSAFDVRRIRGELPIGGLGFDILLGILPPFILTAMAACS